MKKNIIYVLLISVSILFVACGSNSKEDPIVVQVDPASLTNVGGYEFMNFTREINVTEYKKYEIPFQLVHDGIPADYQKVTVKAFDKSYGSVWSRYGDSQTVPGLPSQSVITDPDGIGLFIYTPPEVLPADGSTYDLELVYLGITIADSNDTATLTQKITLKFNANSNISNGRASTLSIVYGYKSPKGKDTPNTGNEGVTPGTGDRHQQAEWDGEKSKMINYYAVHAVDEDGRRSIVDMEIKMSLINNAKKINGRIIQDNSGTINNTVPIQFSDTSANYIDPTLYASQRVAPHDNLIILPSETGVDPSYLGGWKINVVTQSALNLEGNFLNLERTEDLSYVIGNERRLLGRNIVVADIDRIDVESITDEYGMAYFKVTFDPELAGHTVTLEAHGVDVDNNRIGISRIATLRWDKYVGGPATIATSGSIVKVPMTLSIDGIDGANHHLIDIDIVPSSFTVEKSPFCSLNEGQSNFHTSSGGQVLLAINTDGNTSATGGEDKCTIKWNGGAGSIYFEY